MYSWNLEKEKLLQLCAEGARFQFGQISSLKYFNIVALHFNNII